MTSNATVAVLGAGGTMGLAMARNIARAGIGVRAWDRTPDKATPLQDDGAALFDSPREAVDGADVILTMLVDADAVLDTMDHALDAPRQGVVWLQMSTIGESGTDRCAEFAQAHGLTLVDAPVLGTKQPAEEGKLVILAGGPDEAKDRVEPIFEAVGQKTIWAGEIGAGTRLKMVTNAWLVAVVEGGAEAIALAEGLDLDPRLLLDALEGGPLDLPYLRVKAKSILEHNFEPSFKLKLAAKDARLIEEAAERHGLDVPLFSTVRRRLAEGAKEHGDEDISATYLTSAPKARST